MSIAIKCVVLGDGAVGKTSLLISYTTNSFPEEYVPTVFDNYSANVLYGNDTIALSLWDTAGQSDYDRTRPLSYPETQVFLLCVSTVNRTSLENAKSKWVPEVKQFSTEVPIVLCGTKMDLRSDQSYVAKITEQGESIVTTDDGLQLMREIDALAYNECSAKSHKGLKEVFISCIKAVLDPPKKEVPKGNNGGCCILV